MKSLRFRSWTLLAPFALFYSCAGDPPAECGQICREAAKCGLLPSPLGAQTSDDESVQQNCEARCANSDDTQWQQISECFAPLIAEDAGDADWCSGAESNCLRAARCLQERYPGTPILGQATLVLSTRGPSGGSDCERKASDYECPLDAGAAAEGGASGTGGAPSSPPMCRLDVGKLCSELNEPQVTFEVQRYAKSEAKSTLSCAEGLAQDVRFEDLIPGLAQASVAFFGVIPEPTPSADGGGGQGGAGSPSGAAGSSGEPAIPPGPYCVRFASVPVELRAATETSTTVYVEADTAEELLANGSPCELGTALCQNGLDDDLDELVDCFDPECGCDPPVVLDASAPNATSDAAGAGGAANARTTAGAGGNAGDGSP